MCVCVHVYVFVCIRNDKCENVENLPDLMKNVLRFASYLVRRSDIMNTAKRQDAMKEYVKLILSFSLSTKTIF